MHNKQRKAVQKVRRIEETEEKYFNNSVDLIELEEKYNEICKCLKNEKIEEVSKEDATLHEKYKSILVDISADCKYILDRLQEAKYACDERKILTSIWPKSCYAKQMIKMKIDAIEKFIS